MAAALLLVPRFQTAAIALASLWAPSVQKWSIYEKGEKFGESGKKGRKKWRPGEKVG